MDGFGHWHVGEPTIVPSLRIHIRMHLGTASVPGFGVLPLRLTAMDSSRMEDTLVYRRDPVGVTKGNLLCGGNGRPR